MGKSKGPYNPEFGEGTLVRIVDTNALEQFMRNWRWHNPLQAEQLKFGGQRTTVKKVHFYHGGDELYELKDVTGLWHEECLLPDTPEQ